MAGRVSYGGQEMNLQDALSLMEEQLQAARLAAGGGVADQLNATLRETLDQVSARPNFDLVNTIEAFDGETPESIERFFSNLEDVGDLSNWTSDERLRIAKLKITGAALKFVRSEDQTKLATYADFKATLTERFSDKAPQHCYFQQLSVIQQRRGETIEAFSDRVRALNEKTIRVTASADVNKALREEADRRALDAFLRGLMGGVGEQTRLKFPTTLREAVTTAVAIEHLLKPAGAVLHTERKVFQGDVTCFNCHRKGHVSRDCRAKRSEDTGREGKRGPASPRVVCWRCQRPGHVQKDCRVKLTTKSENEAGARGFADTKPRQ